jgi:hypothetical protein
MDKSIRYRRCMIYCFAALNFVPFIVCLYLLKLNNYNVDYFWSATVVGGSYLLMIFCPIVLGTKMLEKSPLKAQRYISLDLVAVLGISIAVYFNLIFEFIDATSMSYLVLTITMITIAIFEIAATGCIVIYKQVKTIKSSIWLIEAVNVCTIFTMLLYVEWMHKLQ